MYTFTQALLAALLVMASTVCAALEIREYTVPKGSHPHNLVSVANVLQWPQVKSS